MFNFANAREHMVESQIRTSDVTDLDVVRAFRGTLRENFVPKAKSALAYSDTHVDLGEGRYLMAPRDIAKMIQAADVQSSDLVLDIACGRGYSSAILAQLAETVVALEDCEERVSRATDTLLAADITNAVVVQGNLVAGAAEHGPFNVIFVNGAVSKVSDCWLSQLANNGRLVSVVKDGPIGRATVFTKAGDRIGQRIVFDANVPALEALKPAPEFVF